MYGVRETCSLGRLDDMCWASKPHRAIVRSAVCNPLAVSQHVFREDLHEDPSVAA